MPRHAHAVTRLLLLLPIGSLVQPGLAQPCNFLSPPTPSDVPDLAFVDANADGIDGMACGPIFVSTAGQDSNPGTRDRPMRSIAAAVTAASLYSPRRSVYVSSGVYTEVVVTSGGIRVYGGYDPVTWQRSQDRPLLQHAGRPLYVGTNAASSETAEFALLAVLARTALDPGDSNVGIVKRENTHLLLSGCTLTVEPGSTGALGGTGAAGSPGLPGGLGGAGYSGMPMGPNAGSAGAGSSPGGAGGTGGHGGSTGSPGSTGSAGAPGGAGGTPSPCGAASATMGGAGSAGGSGANGDSGAGALGWWSGSAGSAGLPGAGGGGGGGGGGGAGSPPCTPDRGGGGGGGGAGGAGGQPGGGGGRGGSSIAIVFRGGSVTTDSTTTISVGPGGNGGHGGAGGLGGSGGLGGDGGSGIDDSAAGGPGGLGGQGGHGGPGGGGGGGFAAAIVQGAGHFTFLGPVDVGLGGAGGAGGTNAAGDSGGEGLSGISGVSLTTLTAFVNEMAGYDNPPASVHARLVCAAGTASAPTAALGLDPDFDVTTYALLSPSAVGGVASQIGPNSFVFTPHHTFSGWTSFPIRASDAEGRSVDGFAVVYVRCRSDADGNGTIQPADIGLFVTTWSASISTGTMAGDYDGNGVVNPSDVGAFVSDWFAALTNGC